MVPRGAPKQDVLSQVEPNAAIDDVPLANCLQRLIRTPFFTYFVSSI